MDCIPLHQTSLCFIPLSCSTGLNADEFQVNSYITKVFYPEYALLSKGETIFQLKSEFAKSIYSEAVWRISPPPRFFIQLKSKPSHETVYFRGPFLPLDQLAAEFTSSAACFELRSASSLCAEGAWDLHAS